MQFGFVDTHALSLATNYWEDAAGECQWLNTNSCASTDNVYASSARSEESKKVGLRYFT
jgi:hypothetical protein